MRSPPAALRLLAVGCAALALTGISGGEDPRGGQHSDAVPGALPPGYEVMDVSEEMEQIRSREVRELEQQVDVDARYRTITPEARIRARYGSATWNLYEPHH